MKRYTRSCYLCGRDACVLLPPDATELDVEAEFSGWGRSVSDVEDGDPVGVICRACARKMHARAVVSVEPFRDRFVSMCARGEITARGLARDLGWYRQASPCTRHRQGRVPDGQRARRTLGVAAESSRGRSYHRRHVNYDLAERLCAALNLDPWEAGL